MSPAPKTRWLIVSLFRSKRAYLAVGVDGLLSISTLLMTVATARQSSVSEFGVLAFTLTLYMLVIGVFRATVTDTTLSLPSTPENLSSGYQKILFAGLLSGASLLVVGLATEIVYLVILGVGLPGLLAMDYIRVTASALYRASVAFRLATLWSLSSASVSSAALFLQIPAPWVFAAWGFSGAVLGIIAGKIQGLPSRPKWNRQILRDRTTSWFALDYLAGSGGSQLTTAMLGLLVTPTLLAALRGAGTLLGPANLVSTSARSLMLPFLTRARAISEHRERRLAAVATVLLAVISALLGLTIILLAPLLGIHLLGETWTVAKTVLVPLAIESVFALAGSVPSAGHRMRFAGRRAAVLRLSVGVLRPSLVIPAAFLHGAAGAAWVMAFLSAVSLVLWWASYAQLLRQSERSARRSLT